MARTDADQVAAQARRDGAEAARARGGARLRQRRRCPGGAPALGLRRHRRPLRACASSSSASPSATRRGRGPGVPAALITGDAKGLVERSTGGRGGRAHRRRRPRSGARGVGAGGGEAGRDGQQGAAGRPRGGLGGSGRLGRARPSLRSRRGGCDPAHPPVARVARGRADPPGHGHRQRHHQLHPDDDVGGRGLLHPGPGRGPTPGARRARSQRRRRRTRRRGQGGHPRRVGVSL